MLAQEGLNCRQQRHVLATAAKSVAWEGQPWPFLASSAKGEGASRMPGHSKAPPQQVECCQRCLLQLPVVGLRMQCGNCGMPKDAKLSKPDANPAESPPLMEHHMLKVISNRFFSCDHISHCC